MDALKAEVASKRKTIQDDSMTSSRPNKYMRRGDIERLKEEQELKVRQEKEQKEREERESIAARKAKVSIQFILSISTCLILRWRIDFFDVRRRLTCPCCQR